MSHDNVKPNIPAEWVPEENIEDYHRNYAGGSPTARGSDHRPPSSGRLRDPR